MKANETKNGYSLYHKTNRLVKLPNGEIVLIYCTLRESLELEAKQKPIPINFRHSLAINRPAKTMEEIDVEVDAHTGIFKA